jgi:hypothetical protein
LKSTASHAILNGSGQGGFQSVSNDLPCGLMIQRQGDLAGHRHKEFLQHLDTKAAVFLLPTIFHKLSRQAVFLTGRTVTLPSR